MADQWLEPLLKIALSLLFLKLVEKWEVTFDLPLADPEGCKANEGEQLTKYHDVFGSNVLLITLQRAFCNTSRSVSDLLYSKAVCIMPRPL